MKKLVILVFIALIMGTLYWTYSTLTEEPAPKVKKITKHWEDTHLQEENKSSKNQKEPTNSTKNETHKRIRVFNLEFNQSEEYLNKPGEEAKLPNETLARILYLGESFHEAFGVRLFEEDMPTFLKTYSITLKDGSPVDYIQRIELSKKLAVANFTDPRDPERKNFTIGINISSREEVMKFSIIFEKKMPLESIVGQKIHLLGKEYYVVNFNNETRTYKLLESPFEFSLSPNEEILVNYPGYGSLLLSIAAMDHNKTFLKVNNVLTDAISVNDYFNEGNFTVALKEILWNEKNEGLIDVVVSPFLLKFGDAMYIETGDGLVDDLIVQFVPEFENYLNRIDIIWKTDKEEYILFEKDLELPYFKTFNFSVSDYDYDEDDNVFVYGYISSRVSRLLEVS